MNTERILLAGWRSSTPVSLAPKSRFWLRFLGGIFVPTVLVLLLVIAGNWNKTVVELANVPIPASRFVWASIALLGSNALVFGGALAWWFRRRGSLHFASYEDYAGRAISLACRSLLVVWFGIPVVVFITATPETAFVSGLISMLFGLAYQGFVGFPILFGTVFFLGWMVFQKTEID